jgi:hypothetical protein
MCRGDPRSDRVPRLLGDFELHWSLGLLLHDNCPGRDPAALDDIVDAETNQVASTQLAVDCEIEQGEFTGLMSQLQTNPDRPDLFQLQRGLLAEQLALVPRYCATFGLGNGIHESLLCCSKETSC